MRIRADAGPDRNIYLGDRQYMSLADSYSLTSSYQSCHWQEAEVSIHQSCSAFYYEPTTTGVKTLTLTLTDYDGLTDSDSVDIVVTEREMRIYADAGKDQSMYLGNRLYLSRNESYTLTSFFASCTWSAGDEVLYSSTSSFCGAFYYEPTALGRHPLTLTVTDRDGLTDSDEVYINVIERDKEIYADATNDRTIYLGNFTTLTRGESYSLTSYLQCEWADDSGVVSTSCNSFRYTPDALGDHRLTLTVRDSDGLEDSDEVVVTAVERDQRIYADAGKDRTFYLDSYTYVGAGESYSLTSGLQCEWSDNTGVFSNSCSSVVRYTPATAGEYVLTLTVRDSDGLEDSDDVIVSVIERDQRIFADAGKDRTVYLGQRFWFNSGESYSLTSSRTCEWRQEETVLSSTSCSYIYVTPETLGEFVYTLTVRDQDGLEDTDEMVVTVVERDQQIYADAGLDQSVFLGDFVDVGRGNESYSLSATPRCEWLKDGLVVHNVCTYFRFRPDTFGTHTFGLRVYDDTGLEDFDEVNVHVLDPSLDDTTPPELTLLGNSVDSIVVHGSALTLNTIGIYDIIYTVSDERGNTTSATRMVNVLPVGTDIAPPVISLNGFNPTTLVQGNTYSIFKRLKSLY